MNRTVSNKAGRLRLARTAGGRILLHLSCLLRGGHSSFHLAGVKRECVQILRSIELRR